MKPAKEINCSISLSFIAQLIFFCFIDWFFGKRLIWFIIITVFIGSNPLFTVIILFISFSSTANPVKPTANEWKRKVIFLWNEFVGELNGFGVGYGLPRSQATSQRRRRAHPSITFHLIPLFYLHLFHFTKSLFFGPLIAEQTHQTKDLFIVFLF